MKRIYSDLIYLIIRIVKRYSHQLLINNLDVLCNFLKSRVIFGRGRWFSNLGLRNDSALAWGAIGNSVTLVNLIDLLHTYMHSCTA
jgi:hypothetical protein